MAGAVIHDRARPAPVLASIGAVVLGLVIPAVLASATPEPVHDSWLGCAVIAALAGLRFAVILGSRTRRPAEMTTWLFVYLFLGLAPMTQLRLGAELSTTPGILHEYDWTAVGIVIAGMLSLMAGSALGARKSSSGATRDGVMATQLSRGRLRLLSLVTLVLAILYVGRVGVGAMFSARQVREVAVVGAFGDPSVASLVGAVINMGLLSSVIVQVAARRSRLMAGTKPPSIFLLVISLLVLAVCVNPISSPRYLVGTVALAVLASFGLFATPRRFRVTAVATLVGFVIGFPILDTFRRSVSAEVTVRGPLQSFVSGDYDSFNQINNAASYVARAGIEIGQQALGVVLFWVPRSVWPGKPIDTGALIANFRGYEFTNLSAPLWAELFVNGGWVALVLGMLFLGFVLRRFDAKSETRLLVYGVPSLLGCILPFYLLILLRGSLLQAMANLAVILAIAWFARGRPSGDLRPAVSGVSAPREGNSRGADPLRPAGGVSSGFPSGEDPRI